MPSRWFKRRTLFFCPAAVFAILVILNILFVHNDTTPPAQEFPQSIQEPTPAVVPDDSPQHLPASPERSALGQTHLRVSHPVAPTKGPGPAVEEVLGQEFSSSGDQSELQTQHTEVDDVVDPATDEPIIPQDLSYHELFSMTTTDRKFFLLDFGDYSVSNPSLIPHPTRHDRWIAIAVHGNTRVKQWAMETLTCEVGWLEENLACLTPPTTLPVEPSLQGNCDGDLSMLALLPGPRDPRMFYSPTAPYIVYGSQSSVGCLGMWLQDVRMLLRQFIIDRISQVQLFRQPAELVRPLNVGVVEKNYFLFWDTTGRAYVHYDVWPSRSFVQLDFNGKAFGGDLAAEVAAHDDVCMAKYMPKPDPSRFQSVHQATNSLMVTLCDRYHPDCHPSEDNTYIMAIFHLKKFWEFHSEYDPYVMLFECAPPFSLYAISRRPFWIHGRQRLTPASQSDWYPGAKAEEIPQNHTEMFYVTSMSWKTHWQKYNGFLDDPLFLGIGVEDSRAGVMDVRAGDLLDDLVYC